jgi:hypothetical protein
VSRLETVEARRVELANPVRPILFSTLLGHRSLFNRTLGEAL